MLTISNNKTMPAKLQRSVTNPSSLLASLNTEPLTVMSSMSGLTSPTASIEVDLSLSIATDLPLTDSSSTGAALNSAVASFAEHRARREWKARQHLRRFRQRYLETIEEDCFSAFSDDDDDKENMMSRDVNSNVVKTSRKKKRKTPKKHGSSSSKISNDVVPPPEKLYFSNSSGDSTTFTAKKSSGRLYFPSPDGRVIVQNETSRKQEASEGHRDNVVNIIKPSAEDFIKVEGSPIIMWSDDKTFLCDHTALASASLKTKQIKTTKTYLESNSIDDNTLMTFTKPKDEAVSPEQLEVTSFDQTEEVPIKQNGKCDEVTSANVVEEIENFEIVNGEPRRTITITDEADRKLAWKNISRISGSSRTSLREQTSAGNLVSGAFHSTFSYPLHSTIQQTEQSVLSLSPIALPGSPVYNIRRPKQTELQPINSKLAITKNRYVRREMEITSSDNVGSCRPLNSAKKAGRASGSELINKNYGGWSSSTSERIQSTYETPNQNFQNVRLSRKLGELYPVSDNNPLKYKDWMLSTRSNDCLRSAPVITLEHRRTPLKRSVGCTRIGLHTLQSYACTTIDDPRPVSLEAERGSHTDLNSFSTDRSSANGSSLSTVHPQRDSSIESFEQSRNYASAESHLRRRQTHQHLYENSWSTLEQDGATNDTRRYNRRQCAHHVHKHRECCAHRAPSTPRHIHPACQRHNTLPDLIRLPSSHHEVYQHECAQRRISAAAASRPSEQPYLCDERKRRDHFISDEVSTRLGTTARKSEKRNKTPLGGRKLGCFTRMMCTNSEVTQIFTSDPFE